MSRAEQAVAPVAGWEGEAAWTSSLDALSGGQRTLISLAFILAVSETFSAASWLRHPLEQVELLLVQDEPNSHTR